jgi:hypothetical protein
MSRSLRAACASLLVLGGAASAAEWGYDVQAGIAYDDNVSNAFESEDRKADAALLLTFAGGLYQHPRMHGPRTLRRERSRSRTAARLASSGF